MSARQCVAETEFVNEVGNAITVSVQAAGDQVLIRIVGPDSVGEERITQREAAELHSVLGRYLGGISK